MIKRMIFPHSYSLADSPLLLGQAKQAELGTVIHCLVWNIWKARRRGWLEQFAHLIKDRDLVILQEAVSNAPSDGFFAHSEQFEWIMARSHRHPRTAIETGVKTGCIAANQSSCVFASPHSEPILNTKKMLLQTLYRLNNGSELMVLNMHAINFVSNKKYSSHLDQLAAAVEQHTGPVILAGDFNTWSLKRHSHFRQITTRAGLVEAKMQRQQKWAHLNQDLDHVFYRGLKLRSIESLSHIKLSDHSPIAATFEQESN